MDEIKLYRMDYLAEMYSRIKDKDAYDFWDCLLTDIRSGYKYKYGGSIGGDFDINDEFFYIKKSKFGNSVDLVSVPKRLLKNMKKHYNANVYSPLKF